MTDGAADAGVAEDEGTPPASADAAAPTFFIVGVGASAGGFEALTALLTKIELERMAVVMVQHLAPKHESLLAHAAVPHQQRRGAHRRLTG